jgi:peptide chain release factor 1
MHTALDEKLARYRELEQQWYDPATAADPVRAAAVARERGALAKIVEPYLELQRLDAAIQEAQTLAAQEEDAELRALAEEELAALRQRREKVWQRLEEELLIDPAEDFSRVIMEIRAGEGGDEAALFAGDLYGMYIRYARSKGWTVEDIAHQPGDAGGFKEVIFAIEGENVYRYLRHESGGHRVQRVPATETMGRIHTSLATVAVLPEPDEVQVVIKPEDIEWERMRAGGAGGQHVNKTESAVRIWYKKGTPEELEVKCQDERSQHKNYERAMRILRTRLFQRQQQKLQQERADLRRVQVGSGERGSKIRTYHFKESRVTDHRIGLTIYKLDEILSGNLDLIIEPLREHWKQQKLASLGA